MPVPKKKSLAKKKNVKLVKREQKMKIKFDKEDDEEDKKWNTSPKLKKRFDQARQQGTQDHLEYSHGNVPVKVVKRKKKGSGKGRKK